MQIVERAGRIIDERDRHWCRKARNNNPASLDPTQPNSTHRVYDDTTTSEEATKDAPPLKRADEEKASSSSGGST